MRERPIFFSSPMVRAILSGAKTQTRRVVKVRCHSICENDDGKLWPWSEDVELAEDFWHPCPFGEPGDRLWVREAFIHEPADYCWEASASIPCRPALTVYRADHEGDTRGAGWKPSIHMPRWASRITLEITDVRVERLQDISEADAKAEGVSMPDGTPTPPDFWSYQQEFRHLWEQIHGGGSWEKNPWVWVIEFKKLESGECAT